MATELHMGGTPGQVTTAVNALTPSNHPGMASMLVRAQAAAVAEINAWSSSGATRVTIDFTCHADNLSTHISIRVQPSRDP